MDIVDRIHLSGTLGGLSSRVRTLQKKLGGWHHRARALRGPALLVAAGTAAWFAQAAARERAYFAWGAAHPPPLAAWKYALEAHQFKPPASPSEIRRNFRTLPAEIDTDGSVWISSDQRRIAVFKTGGAASADPADYYCLGCADRDLATPPAGSWKPLGRGWEAFGPAQSEAGNAEKAWIAINSPKPERPKRDPREIVY